ncbi:hypothetical protein RhiirC2_844647 [Rhizophagus irregularis]|uniref:Uncharacterized protein n=1 Tax=Rhizophagus irregularis TaxID=588596 RepID=A0A2N1NT59_9GLOM|nr:hypothetical protein RhiirC2_844647 [Rhizophagus irregularis]
MWYEYYYFINDILSYWSCLDMIFIPLTILGALIRLLCLRPHDELFSLPFEIPLPFIRTKTIFQNAIERIRVYLQISTMLQLPIIISHTTKVEESTKVEVSHTAKVKESTKVEDSHTAKVKESTKVEDSHTTKVEDSHTTKVKESHTLKVEESHTTKFKESHTTNVKEFHTTKESHTTKVIDSHTTNVKESHTTKESHNTKVVDSHTTNVNISTPTLSLPPTPPSSFILKPPNSNNPNKLFKELILKDDYFLYGCVQFPKYTGLFMIWLEEKIMEDEFGKKKWREFTNNKMKKKFIPFIF